MLFLSGKKIRYEAGLLACLLAWASCETKGPECYQPITVNLSNGFIVTDSVRVYYYIPPDSTRNDSIGFVYHDSIMAFSEMKVLDKDTLFRLIGTEAPNNVMSISLDPSTDSIRYTFRADTASSVFDTITYYYTSTIHFVSNSCGYNYYYTLNNVKSTGNMLDSIALINNQVTNDASVRNVQFYFKKNF